MKTRIIIILATLIVAAVNGRAATVGTEFTYQGRLTDATGPATGSYDFAFTLHLAASGGVPVVTVTNVNRPVSNGLFTATVDFGGGVYNGNAYWISLGVRSNGTGGSFVSLTPRQPLTPTPNASYASLAGTVPGGSITSAKLAVDSVTVSALQNNAVTAAKVAAGQLVKSLNGLRDDIVLSAGPNLTITPSGNTLTIGGSSDWKLSGNAGTTPGTQFVGTTDNLPMDFKVNGARALRLEPNPNAPNVIGGSAANEVTNGIYGAVIAGGGSSFYPNRVGAIFGTVVGGSGNTASGNSATAMGQFNTASGYAGTAMGYSTVAGGFGSQAGGTTAKANHDGAFVWADNNFADFTSTAANQFLIRAAGGVGINNNNPNGAALAVNGNITVNNTIGTPGNQPLELKVNGTRALRLEPTVNDSNHSNIVNVIGGSSGNFVAPGYIGATIGGGGAGNYLGQAYTNLVSGHFGTVGGGLGNTSSGDSATVGGGYENSSGYLATVGGGYQNISSGSSATVPGGANNTAGGQFSFAAGLQAKALHNGAFVWADSQGADFSSTAINQFLIRASGGVGIGVTSPQQPLSVATGMNIDQNDVNAGTVANTLRFGSGSGEAIGSKRTPGGNRWGLDFYTASAHRMTILNTGEVGIGTPAPSEKLHVLGNILASGTITGSSDRNVKTNSLRSTRAKCSRKLRPSR
jgi:hypothetical protein